MATSPATLAVRWALSESIARSSSSRSCAAAASAPASVWAKPTVTPSTTRYGPGTTGRFAPATVARPARNAIDDDHDTRHDER